MNVIYFLLGCAVTWAVFVYRSKYLSKYGQHEEPQASHRDAGLVLMDTMPDPFFLIDKEGVVVVSNQAANLIFGPQELIGRSILEVLGDARLGAPYLECRENRLPVTSKILLPREASIDRAIEAESLWLVDVAPQDGLGEGVIRLRLRDYSYDHHLEHVRRDFVANASHELRTPITLIDGYLETFLDEPELLEERAQSLKYLGIMKKHTRRISRIIESMLLISRLEVSEALPLNLESFSLKECVQDIFDRLESMIRNQMAVASIELHDESQQIVGDRFYWDQILFNLVENALKQNQSPGLKLRVSSYLKGDELIIEVIDHGLGIPSGDVPFVFKRFYRVAKHHSQNQIKGTGLGLSIVKRAVEAHGGQISCESEPGIETVFRISLPVGLCSV